jgi:hypothetical protein
MFGGDLACTGQVGDCAGKFADFVVCAGAEAELLHRLLQEHFAGRIELAEFLDLFVAHSGVGVNLAVAETLDLDARSSDNVGSHYRRVELAGFRAQLPEAYRRHVDVNIDPVHERPRDLRQVSSYLARRAFALPGVAAEITAGARIHRRDEHELSGKPDRLFRARDYDETIFQRLANHFENMAWKFDKFVQKQYPEMSS